MGNMSNFVKRVRDIMRNDAGINGDAQRIEQIAWMLFLKVYDLTHSQLSGISNGTSSAMQTGSFLPIFS